ncbi:hypothetical protein [Nocardioides sp.]|uniref:hypothetical protein n=1 Tax=Nocardioides sp. TaxID=35761 RepID=UPI00262735E4|nr:hypothetical protein [Nocardioides sp.]MCW2736470.1 hypothetical protein [Nocardioides sp.]MCW2792024.1 hypothetical protein [Nocardioides sp.]
MTFWVWFGVVVALLAVAYVASVIWSYRRQKRLVAGGDPLRSAPEQSGGMRLGVAEFHANRVRKP